MAGAESPEAARIRELEAQLTRLVAEREAAVARLSTERDALASQVARVGSERDALASQVLTLAKKVEALEHDRDRLLKRFFGQKAEKFDPAQLRLVFADEQDLPDEERPAHVDEAPDVESPSKDEQKEEKKKGKGAHGRGGISSKIPREERKHELKAHELPCPGCGDPRRPIGAERTEVLEYRPAQFKVIEHVRTKYACAGCQGHVVCAPIPAGEGPVFDRGRPGPGLLAHLVMSKYSDHLPLNRLEAIYARGGVELSKSTMCDWAMRVADLVVPIVVQLKREMLARGLMGGDETEIRVLDKSAPGGSRKGRIWAWRGERGVVVFQYTPTKEGDWAARFLGDYRGYLQVDAYSGYDRLYRDGKIVEVGCWAHTRRKFFEAIDTAPREAAAAMATIRALYQVEREAKDGGLDAAARLALRKEKSSSIVDEFYSWIEKQAEAVVPGTPLATAVGYAKRLRVALSRFLEDGRIELDNNNVERALRQVAVGRKNWEFAGSALGAERGAALYSIVVSCRELDIDPYEYLRDVIPRLGTTPASEVASLTPRAWKAARPPTPP
jgi:transposase